MLYLSCVGFYDYYVAAVLAWCILVYARYLVDAEFLLL